MLNKLFLIIALFFSVNAFAVIDNKSEVEIVKGNIKIREPFTALGIATLEIQNKTSKDLEVKNITSPQVRHVGTYTSYKNDFGAEQVKRIKNVKIKANETTLFKEGDIFIMLTGLKQKYQPDDTIELNFEFSDNIVVKYFAKVSPSYK